jgi:hypothetical protein
MEAIIQKALDGGWDDTDYAYGSNLEIQPDEWQVGSWRYRKEVLMDVSFWKALMKACDWRVDFAEHEIEKTSFVKLFTKWRYFYMLFFEKIITDERKGFDNAVEWLKEKISK